MGRHMIVSSPLRSPAVVLGVPIATVLATMGSTAVLGGVMPRAEEMPLRAEGAPATPAEAFPGPPSWPSSWSPTAADGIVDAAFDRADAGRPDVGPSPAADATTGTIRVVQVADEPAGRGAAAPSADRIRVVREGPEPTADREAPDAGAGDDERVTRALRAPSDAPVAAQRATASVAESAEPVASAPVSSSSDPPTDGLPRASTASAAVPSDRTDRTDRSEDDPVVDLDTPARGLSVLSFG